MSTTSRYRLLPLILFFLFVLNACRDEPVSPDLFGDLEGVVLDEEMNPIAGVSVSTTPASSATITDDLGMFRISSIAVGEYVVSFSKSDLKGRAVNVAIRSEELQSIQVIMEEKSEEEEDDSALVFPHSPSPEDGAQGLESTVQLAWAADSLNAEGITYNLVVYQGSQDQIFDQRLGLTDTTYTLNAFQGQNYFWQITTVKGGLEKAGPIWSFSTASSTNNRLVFSKMTNAGLQLFSGNVASQAEVQLTRFASGVYWPRINPLNDLVAFASLEEGRWQLYLTDLDGSTPKKLTTLPMDNYHSYGGGFCWSADGKYLIYPHYDKLFRIDYNGTGLTEFATAPADRHFAEVEWAPDNSKIVTRVIGSSVTEDDIYLMDTDGGNMVLLVGNQSGAMRAPSFSIDSRYVYYTVDKSGSTSVDGRQFDAAIFSIHLTSMEVQDLSLGKPSGTNDFFPRVSPDGSSLIFQNGSNQIGAVSNVMVGSNLSDSELGQRIVVFEGACYPDWK
ncbi:carboxypeptidase-like regulatory domain-containing protein [Persicobacter diffluens]|uniref:Fibronectin type-III domain-containing protein n=1 Tax=Persicobacter diffluens TaxID=981 RepID=A0AAN4VW30_9BACT|nr:hypothetical protein PEDI_06580 [Persicobacter diffluens]